MLLLLLRLCMVLSIARLMDGIHSILIAVDGLT